MTVEQTLATNNATDASDQNLENQALAAKTFTQEEVNAILARTKSQIEKKFTSKYEDLGDPDELRTIKTEWEQRQQEQQLKRGEFEKTLQEKAVKWEAEIQKRDSIIKEYKVNTPLLSAAAKYRAVAPEQVKSLLAQHVRLNADGEVEVIDDKGAVRYTDQGQAVDVDLLVQEWLHKNPHFVSSAPGTTNTKSSTGNTVSNGIDISKLDMRNSDHRKMYAEMQRK